MQNFIHLVFQSPNRPILDDLMYKTSFVKQKYPYHNVIVQTEEKNEKKIGSIQKSE